MSSNITTNYKLPGSVDLGTNFVDKSYLIDVYPYLEDTFKQPTLWTWGG